MEKTNVIRFLERGRSRSREGADTAYITSGKQGDLKLTRLSIGHALKENLGLHEGDRVRVGLLADNRLAIVKDESGVRLHHAGAQGLALYATFSLATPEGSGRIFATVENGMLVFPAGSITEERG